MCTDSEIDNNLEVIGESTENAIVSKALEYGINKDKLYSNMQRINEIPFDSERKLMSTIHKNGNRYRIITKGALDVLLNRCKKIYKNGDVKTITQLDKKEILEKNSNMANKALRVLGVAFLDIDILPKEIDTKTIENNLIFVRTNRNDRSSKRRGKKCD